MNENDVRSFESPDLGPPLTMKNIGVREDTWAILCMLKAATKARSMDEVISRLLVSQHDQVKSQMSLFLESARYGELTPSDVPDLPAGYRKK